MEKEREENGKLFGLIGKDISYSFSRAYFTKKFKALRLKQYRYVNFDIASITDFPSVIKQHPDLKGLNVTIPYKEKIIPYLHGLSKAAHTIKAVNTITFTKAGLTGHNTDYYGFKRSLAPLLKPYHKKALILGTGGAAKAVAYTLQEMDISYRFVSRKPDFPLNYTELNEEIIRQHLLIVHCTPVGTAPETEARPPIPYPYLTSRHLLYDLVYNPAETAFLKAGKSQGATVCNGLEMLRFQAEKAWKLWNG